jgi:hypothetical protein
MKRQPTVADIVMFAGGAVTFLFSFLHFIDNTNAWGTGLFPVTTLIALLGLAMAVFVALDVLIGFRLPIFLTFNYKQMYVTWGITAAGFMLCYLIVDKGGADTGAGLYLMLIGSLAMAVGSVLNVLEIATQALNVGTTSGRPKTAPPPPPGSDAAPGRNVPPPPPPGVSQPVVPPSAPPAPPAPPSSTPPPPPPPPR